MLISQITMGYNYLSIPLSHIKYGGLTNNYGMQLFIYSLFHIKYAGLREWDAIPYLFPNPT